jgi:hypothetical protein
MVVGNTFYGEESKLGDAINVSSSNNTTDMILNNIFYGWTNGITTSITGGSTQTSTFEDYNDFYNNTTDRTNIQTGSHSVALAPTFTSAAQLSGSTATTSSSTLTQSGGDFSTVTDGADSIRIVSGTGVTAGLYPITSHTSTTVTSSIAFGTDATADKAWKITTGHNFAIGTNLKAKGFPGAFQGGLTTGYMDIGAVQRQEAGAGTSATYFH